ncbi:MAG TPA: response regulator transcription factor [Acidimicrobiia bacterium]|nr:response regulator transcription factor [Acidimicrobiia bacterium]
MALVNDFELVLRGLAGMLDPFRDRLRVVELDVGTRPKQSVDVALFDTYGHPHNGIDRIRALADDPRVGAVVVYTWAITSEQCEAALAAGARGVIAKSEPAEALVRALIAIDGGELVVSPNFRRPHGYTWPGHDLGLTARESEVAAFLSEGMSNRDMADALLISEHTVKSHLKAIFQKTGVASRAQAVARIAADPRFRRVRDVG